MKGRVMSNLLEIKEAIKKIYSKYETYIFPVVKFLIAFIAFVSIKNQLGYMTRINSMAILLIVCMHFVLPAILTLSISEFMRKKGIIAKGDMALKV